MMHVLRKVVLYIVICTSVICVAEGASCHEMLNR